MASNTSSNHLSAFLYSNLLYQIPIFYYQLEIFLAFLLYISNWHNHFDFALPPDLGHRLTQKQIFIIGLFFQSHTKKIFTKTKNPFFKIGIIHAIILGFNELNSPAIYYSFQRLLNEVDIIVCSVQCKSGKGTAVNISVVEVMYNQVQ